jgi:HK97 family phage portal protein
MLGRLVRNTVTDLPWTARYDQDLDTAPPTWSGKHVTVDTAQQLLVVYGAAAFHADHLSTMPIDQYRKLPDGSRQPLPTDAWLEEPYPGLDITDALSQMWWSYWMGGHALAPIVRNSLGRIVGFLPLHPSQWSFDQRGRLLVGGKPMGGEFISIPHVLVPGQWRGVNPIEAARQTIGLGLAAAEFGGGFFARGTTMSGVIQMPGDAPNQDDLDILRNNWVKTYGGSGNAHKPGILFGGATWQQISITPEDAQFLETRGFTDAQICSQLMQLPPTALSIPMPASGTIQYQNIESAWSEIVRRWIPHLYKFKRAFSKLVPRPQYIEWNVDRYLAATAKERAETMKLELESGVLLPDEARALRDRGPVPGGDLPPWQRPTTTPAAAPAPTPAP